MPPKFINLWECPRERVAVAEWLACEGWRYVEGSKEGTVDLGGVLCRELEKDWRACECALSWPIQRQRESPLLLNRSDLVAFMAKINYAASGGTNSSAGHYLDKVRATTQHHTTLHRTTPHHTT